MHHWKTTRIRCPGDKGWGNVPLLNCKHNLTSSSTLACKVIWSTRGGECMLCRKMLAQEGKSWRAKNLHHQTQPFQVQYQRNGLSCYDFVWPFFSKSLHFLPTFLLNKGVSLFWSSEVISLGSSSSSCLFCFRLFEATLSPVVFYDNMFSNILDFLIMASLRLHFFTK